MSGICQADADASYQVKKEAQMDKMGDTAPKVLNVMTQMLGVVMSGRPCWQLYRPLTDVPR